MKILGFGDSFILGLEEGHAKLPYTYQGILGEHFNTYAEFKGISGSGPWTSFFDCQDYLTTTKEHPDVVIFAWSEINRLYNDFVKILNYGIAKNKENDTTDVNHEVYQAALGYYKHFASTEKPNYEMAALMLMFDEFTLNFPKTKFINLHCFSWLKGSDWWDVYDTIDYKDINYFHKFKNCAEVRPPLIYMSRRDGWPKDISKESRECHLTEKMHKLLANAIIECIRDYKPGKTVEIPAQKII